MRFVFSIILATLPITAAAQDGTDPCAALGKYANLVMTMRQDGASMSEARRQVEETIHMDAALALAKRMIMVAYEQPIADTKKDKQNAIIEFQNAVEYGCYKVADSE